MPPLSPLYRRVAADEEQAAAVEAASERALDASHLSDRGGAGMPVDSSQPLKRWTWRLDGKRTWWKRFHDDMEELLVDENDPDATPLQIAGRKLLASVYFNVGMAIVILGNGVVIGLEVDFPEDAAYHDLEEILLVVFVLELGLRMVSVGGRSFFSLEGTEIGWNMFDLGIVLIGTADWVLSEFGGFAPTQGDSARRAGASEYHDCIQIIQLLRLLRILRLVRFLKHLHVLTFGFVAAAGPIRQVSLLMLALIYTSSVVFVSITNGGAVYDSDMMVKNFGSVGRCMMSMFTLMCVPDLSGYFHILTTCPATAAFFVTFVIFGSFGVLGLLNGLICESMFEKNEAKMQQERIECERKRQNLVDKCEGFFARIKDATGEATIEDCEELLPEIAQAFMDEGVQFAFQDLQILLDCIDTDGSGSVSREEFCDGVLQLAEGLRPMSLVQLHYVTSLTKVKVDACENLLRQVTAQQDRSQRMLFGEPTSPHGDDPGTPVLGKRDALRRKSSTAHRGQLHGLSVDTTNKKGYLDTAIQKQFVTMSKTLQEELSNVVTSAIAGFSGSTETSAVHVGHGAAGAGFDAAVEKQLGTLSSQLRAEMSQAIASAVASARGAARAAAPCANAADGEWPEALDGLLSERLGAFAVGITGSVEAATGAVATGVASLCDKVGALAEGQDSLKVACGLVANRLEDVQASLRTAMRRPAASLAGSAPESPRQGVGSEPPPQRSSPSVAAASPSSALLRPRHFATFPVPEADAALPLLPPSESLFATEDSVSCARSRAPLRSTLTSPFSTLNTGGFPNEYSVASASGGFRNTLGLGVRGFSSEASALSPPSWSAFGDLAGRGGLLGNVFGGLNGNADTAVVAGGRRSPASDGTLWSQPASRISTSPTLGVGGVGRAAADVGGSPKEAPRNDTRTVDLPTLFCDDFSPTSEKKFAGGSAATPLQALVRDDFMSAARGAGFALLGSHRPVEEVGSPGGSRVRTSSCGCGALYAPE